MHIDPVPSQLSSGFLPLLCATLTALKGSLAWLTLTSHLQQRFPKRNEFRSSHRWGFSSCHPVLGLLEVFRLLVDSKAWPNAGRVENMRNKNLWEVCCIHRDHEHHPNPGISFTPFWVPPQSYSLVRVPDSPLQQAEVYYGWLADQGSIKLLSINS